jgi:Protein of unknown function (DUF3396)
LSRAAQLLAERYSLAAAQRLQLRHKGWRKGMEASNLDAGSAADRAALKHLDDIFVPYPINPDPCLKVSFRAVLFFEGGGTLEKRLAGFHVLVNYAKRYSDHLSHVQHVSNGRAKITPLNLDDIFVQGEALIRALPPEKECEVGLFTGGISHFGGSLVARGPEPLLPVDISYLEFSVSVSSLLKHGFDQWTQMILEACQRLKPLHGLAGPSIQFDRIYSSTTAHALSFPLIKRFPGIHCARDSTFTIEIQNTGNEKIFSTNWLTIVARKILSRSAEAEAAVSSLPDTCEVHEYGDGLILQAGALPQLGDINRGLVLDDYRRVAQALKPIRFEDYRVGLLDVEQPLDSLEETLKWIRRLD